MDEPLGNPNTEMIEGLAIDPETLIMIKAFVPQLGTYQRGQSPHKQPVQIDPIAGKGEGQIMLLHGPPGTGKTFTTECMAEFSGKLIASQRLSALTTFVSGRALLRLSAGELG